MILPNYPRLHMANMVMHFRMASFYEFLAAFSRYGASGVEQRKTEKHQKLDPARQVKEHFPVIQKKTLLVLMKKHPGCFRSLVVLFNMHIQ